MAKWVRIKRYFIETRNFVSKKFPGLKFVELIIGCSLIDHTRQYDAEGYRAYMHVAHHKDTICVHALAEQLPVRNLRGLFLHEFGHIIGGPKQHQADIAVLDYFGIKIDYDKKDLQYISVN